MMSFWIFVLLNMFLRDLHEFPTEGYIQELMDLKISEELMLLFAFLGEIPILMVVLSLVLAPSIHKWVSTIAVVVSASGILYTLPGGDMDEVFFAVVNAVAFVVILRTAWRLSDTKKSTNQLL